MSTDWSFRFSLPPSAEGTPVTEDELERILRAQVSECARGSREFREATWQLMRFLGMSGRQREGIREIVNILPYAEGPEERADLVLAAGQLMERLGDFESAIEAYSQGVATEAVQSQAWYLLHNNLGYCLNQLGRHVEAERWCRAAIEIDPERHNAYKNVGVACSGQGRHAEAALSFIAAVKAEAADPRALHLLEKLVAEHPEVGKEIPDLDHQLERCRGAVAAVGMARIRSRPRRPPDPRMF